MKNKKSQIGSKDPFLFNNDDQSSDFPQLKEFLLNIDVANSDGEILDLNSEPEENNIPMSINPEFSVIDDEKILSNKNNVIVQFNFENYLDPISLNACIQSLNSKGISCFYNDQCLLFKSEGNQLILSVIPDILSLNYFNLPINWINYFKVIK